jgi:hypothetical protein
MRRSCRRPEILLAACLGGTLLASANTGDACQCESITPFRKTVLGAPVVVVARMESREDCTPIPDHPEHAPACNTAVFRVVEVLRGDFREPELRLRALLVPCYSLRLAPSELWALALPSEPYPLDSLGMAGQKGYTWSMCGNNMTRVRTRAGEEGILLQQLRRWVR